MSPPQVFRDCFVTHPNDAKYLKSVAMQLQVHIFKVLLLLC